eukprot:TRINITY_DN3547_c0_g1_i1.p1 TRINITY_DN3547_c0_g1~~TRINITY_DN3547_c0_g1_i1.p1  ORF type:complete len:381 (-),score=51.06 TRINITY_DN3547_c0_g1_i1:42-1091(-)
MSEASEKNFGNSSTPGYVTKVLTIDPNNFKSSDLDYPVSLVKQKELVVLPTETVYGLGANALSEEATSKIFEAKNRPKDNPLIVHISSYEMLQALTDHVPKKVENILSRFWPGPLTILFKKSSIVPHAVTCGLPTVAIRMPAHPVALALISLSGVPIAAPSANLSGRPSPTEAAHVLQDLNGRVKCIIDGGPCQYGVESTVVDVNSDPPMVLRPGGDSMVQKPPTPGLKYLHYSPRAKVILFEGHPSAYREPMFEKIRSMIAQKLAVGLIHTHPQSISLPLDFVDSLVVFDLGSESSPGEVARGLFKALRNLDDAGVDVIFMEGIGENDEGLAVMNRIRKAAQDTFTFW